MEGESKNTPKYIANLPASVHNYTKPTASESPRTHSSPTSILRKFPHSLRHDQKHQTKIKREASAAAMFTPPVGSWKAADRCVKSWCVGDEAEVEEEEEKKMEEEKEKEEEEEEERKEEQEGEGGERLSSEEDEFRKKRRFSEASSERSSDEGDVWKPQKDVASPRREKQTEKKEKAVGSVKKLSVMKNLCNNGSSVHRAEFPVHKSTPNLVRSETFGSGGVGRSGEGKGGWRRECGQSHRDVPLKSCDSLPQLDQTYRIIHSILPKINRTIAESRESLSSLKNKKGFVKSESHIETFHNRRDRTDSRSLEGKSDVSQSEDESEGLSLIDSRKNIVVQSSKERKGRWSYKKTVERMPSLRHLMSRRIRGGGGGEEEEGGGPPGARAPLMESCSSLSVPQIRYFDEDEEELSVKKCETVYALTNLIRADSNLQVEPMKAINRLRVPPNGFYGSTSRMCSRCSSLLSMASSSRYSINTTGSGFVSCSPNWDKPPEPGILCKLCLMEVPLSLSMEINHCGCVFCKDCMRLYVEFEIQEGAYDISCPDAQCLEQGVVTISEVETLVLPLMMDRYLRFRLNHEVDMDRNRTWCPRAGCETVCNICPREKCAPTSVHCPTCDSDFCSNCKNTWHQGLTCEENSRRLAKEGRSDFMEPGIPFDSDSIKCCPMCNVPIEKDEGCAQMMCKRCKHVFCWYCLASLDDDFLLRHYDKGPCKNKLGHSRASVIWHRTQVIGIFAGLGLLLLVASPLLLLAAPCIVCCKCRVCSGTKMDADDDLPEESAT